MMDLKKPILYDDRYNPPPRIPTNPGDPIAISYAEELDELTGQPHLVEVDRTDLRKLHNADLESTKIANIIARYEAGDPTALDRARSYYADVTSMPNDPITAQNSLLQAKRFFEKQSMDVRRYYNNNYVEWLTAVLNGGVFEPVKKPVEVAPTAESIAKEATDNG